MKVLFAVNDENISTSIVKKYQKKYKEIISYKNVYYFNAILKELQRNKNYDRIVISEDLEEFTSSSYDQKDKFIFDRLDNISDEALDVNEDNIPIILICSERRKKAEEFLNKLFGISIYNAIVGDDRSTDEVCRLINKPRSKKEAKKYYGIDSDDTIYDPVDENEVSEIELQNILNHFKKLGTNEAKYVESFRNIVSQYNENQLNTVIRILPEHVREVLEEKSPEYQKLVFPGGVVPDKVKRRSVQRARNPKGSKGGTSEKLLNADKNKAKLTKPVVVPTNIEKSLYKKTGSKANLNIDLDELEDDDEFEVPEEVIEKKTKRRGRPPKKSEVIEEVEEVEEPKTKRRGRPKKEEIKEEPEKKVTKRKVTKKEPEVEDMLPGFDDEDDDLDYDEDQKDVVTNNNNVSATVLPGFDETEDDYDDDDDYQFDDIDKDEDDNVNISEESQQNYRDDLNTNVMQSRPQEYDNMYTNETTMKKFNNVFDDDEFDSLLAGDKKVVSFLGTSKNGVSFIINNIAQILSSIGINTAIFDATQNKSDYYIYTKNDEGLRKVAVNSLDNLINGNAEGIRVNNNLTVYTNIPSQNEAMKNSFPILETLVKNHTLVLIDCDFETPMEYIEKSQEIYLIQSMDVLTIQPLTAFLRELKVRNMLDERKLRVVLNKVLRLRGVSSKNIVGGMSNYNDPEMSFMTELFDRNSIKVVSQIPFDEDVYIRYLDSLIECEIKLNGYPKEFRQRLNSLAEAVYPLLPNKTGYKGNKRTSNQGQYSSSFSSSMNDTLNNMKRRY